MKFFRSLYIAIISATLANALLVTPEVRDASRRIERDDTSTFADLFKRKGGGGGGGKGGSSSSGSSSGSSSSGGSSSSSGSASGGSAGRTGSTSNLGGSTSRGSGATRSYGGGGYYGGGAAVPYTAGRRSPAGIAPFFLLGAGLAIFPGLWLYGAYAYPYSHPYTFFNQSAANSTFQNGVNQTKAVQCLCANYAACGCDENTNSTYLDSILGNGSYAGLNQSLVRSTVVNGSEAILINGTLPNGTTASGGQDDPDTTSAGTRVAELAGFWVTGAVVVYTVWFL